MRVKNITLYGGMVEKSFSFNISVRVCENSSFCSKGNISLKDNLSDYHRNKKHVNLRRLDREWVHTHIPSSIWWNTEIHHDWENDGIMYLLTKNEHILRHRREKNGK